MVLRSKLLLVLLSYLTGLTISISNYKMLILVLVAFLSSAQLSSAYQSIFSQKQLKARSLKRFTRSQPDNAKCWNRSIEMDGFISPIDAHNHFRAFGGPAVPFDTYLEWMREHGILFSTMMGIGQQIKNSDSAAKPCCYYSDCPTKEYRIVPDPFNDIKNAEDYQRYKKNSTLLDMIHLTLSATYPNLQSPGQIISIMDAQLDNQFPGEFQWAGEINVFKHAAAPNGFFSEIHSPRVNVATVKSGVLDAFFHRMRDNRSPVTLHCDIGCDVKIKPSTSDWGIQATAYQTVQEACAPPDHQIKNIKAEENIKFWKEILTRGDLSHYNAFFDKNTNDPKPNFRKIQHLQVWDAILSRYSDTTIVWAHIGLSKELRTLHPQVHSHIMANLFSRYPNLHADLSWDILAKLLLNNVATYLDILEKFSDRFVTGTDYVASSGTEGDYPGQKVCPVACPSGCRKTKTNHATQLTYTSEINLHLSDKAFKKIVLGENYFRITGLSSTYAPPPICSAEGPGGEPKSCAELLQVGKAAGLDVVAKLLGCLE